MMTDGCQLEYFCPQHNGKMAIFGLSERDASFEKYFSLPIQIDTSFHLKPKLQIAYNKFGSWIKHLLFDSAV